MTAEESFVVTGVLLDAAIRAVEVAIEGLLACECLCRPGAPCARCRAVQDVTAILVEHAD